MTKVLERKIEKATNEARRAARRRDDVIREAHTEGMSIRKIAAVANLSPARVHQLLHAPGRGGDNDA